MKQIMQVLFISVILTSCSYLVLPHKYYTNYTRIKADKNKDTLTLNINSVYAVEDTFLSRFYTNIIKTNVKSYVYLFFYKNNLTARVRTPLTFNGKFYPTTEKDLADSIKNGFFNRSYSRDNITWSYYEVKNNKLIIYGFDYNIASGANALTTVHVDETNYLFLDKGIVSEYRYKKYNPSLKNGLFLPSSLSVKPDSTSATYLQEYNKYITTGKRRFYTYLPDYDKYINSK